MTKEERKAVEKDLARKFLALTVEEQTAIHGKMKELWEAGQKRKRSRHEDWKEFVLTKEGEASRKDLPKSGRS